MCTPLTGIEFDMVIAGLRSRAEEFKNPTPSQDVEVCTRMAIEHLALADKLDDMRGLIAVHHDRD